MAPLLFVALYGIFLASMRLVPTPDSPGLLLVAQLSMALVVVTGPIVIYSFISKALTLRAVTSQAQRWCADRGTTLITVQRHKNHFTAIVIEGGRKHGAKFRVKFTPTTWIVREVNWL